MSAVAIQERERHRSDMLNSDFCLLASEAAVELEDLMNGKKSTLEAVKEVAVVLDENLGRRGDAGLSDRPQRVEDKGEVAGVEDGYVQARWQLCGQPDRACVGVCRANPKTGEGDLLDSVPVYHSPCQLEPQVEAPCALHRDDRDLEHHLATGAIKLRDDLAQLLLLGSRSANNNGVNLGSGHDAWRRLPG